MIHISEHLEIAAFIEKALSNRALTGIDIENLHKSDPNTKNPIKANHSYSEALHILLEDKKIFIVGYECKKKRQQNIGYRDLIFASKKTELKKIRKLIRELIEENSEKNYENVYNEILNLFIDKIHDIEKENFNKWNSDPEKTEKEPKKRNYHEIKTIFDRVLSHIISNKSSIENLVIGLNEFVDSNATLNELVYYATERETILLYGYQDPDAF